MPKERYDPVINYLVSESVEDSLILQDRGLYAYRSGIKDSTLHSWGFYDGLFRQEDIEYIIESTRPSIILVTSNISYPDESYAYFNSEFELIDLGYHDYPLVYATGFSNSTFKPRILHDIISERIGMRD